MSKSRAIELGFLYPGHAAEDDYPRLARKFGPAVEAAVIHTSIGEDAHTVEALSDMGSIPRLLEGASELAKRRPEAAVWSSTSASFVRGRDGAEHQARQIASALNVPASTTALAFLEAVKALGLTRVAVAATYPEDIASLFVRFLGTAGIEVLQVASKDILTATEVGTLEEKEVLRFASENDHAEAEALLIPDTALHTAAWIEKLEERVDKPVLTANQVTFW